MRKLICLVVGMMLLTTAYADLQNVQVGGQIEVRARWYHDAFESGTPGKGGPQPHARYTDVDWSGSPVGVDPRYGLDPGVYSMFRYDGQGNDWSFVEQATSLNVKADFTDNINAMIELYTFSTWGTEFRSNYLTGVDNKGVANVQMLQSYIEVNKLFDQDLRLRVGRQVMQFGKDLNCFLIAGKTNPTNRYSFDGVRATYKPVEKLTLDAWWMKLAELSPSEEDGDTDFYGVYGTYAFCDEANLSAYWMYLRDAQDAQTMTAAQLDTEADLDYPGTEIHTIGTQFTGKCSGFDYNLQVAYQFGDAGKLGDFFQVDIGDVEGTYGDTDAEYDNWGMEGAIGYTFDQTAWKIRPYIAGNYFEGQDNRNSEGEPVASVSFNRLFGDINYCPVVNDNADLTNYWQIGGGVTMSPTEKFTAILRAYNTFVDKTFVWQQDDDGDWIKPSDNLGFSLDTILKYNYSKDLTLILYYGHLFTGEGAKDGAYVSYYGTMMNGGLNDKDADYVFGWAILKF